MRRTHARTRPKSLILSGNSRNHAEYLLHTAKNSAQKFGTLYWRVNDPLSIEYVIQLCIDQIYYTR